MAKYVNKSKLDFKDGRLVKKNKVVFADYSVVQQYNLLEQMVQRAMYLGAQPAYSPAPSLNGFEFESALDRSSFAVGMPETPITDKKYEEAMAYMAEIKSCHQADELNNAIGGFLDLLEFCESDEVLVHKCGCDDRFDGVTLGSPLGLTVDAVKKYIAIVADTHVLEDEEDED